MAPLKKGPNKPFVCTTNVSCDGVFRANRTSERVTKDGQAKAGENPLAPIDDTGPKQNAGARRRQNLSEFVFKKNRTNAFIQAPRRDF